MLPSGCANRPSVGPSYDTCLDVLSAVILEHPADIPAEDTPPSSDQRTELWKIHLLNKSC